jgi:phage-related baseplate assembly protein
MTLAVDLSKLPAPEVIEALDFEAILAARKAKLAELFPPIADYLSLESEPAVKIQELGAYRELLHYARVNDAARAVMVAFARGADLDNLAALIPVTRMAGESDERFRQRVILAPEAYPGAGPAGGLTFHAISADTRVKHVGLSRVPYRGEITVSILSSVDDGAAPADLLDAVRTRLNRDDVRLMTDVITVRPATISPYTIEARLKIGKGPDAALLAAQAEAALTAYTASRHRIGVAVFASALIAAAHVAGVEEVDLISPAADIMAAPHVAPWCSGIALAVEVVGG